MIVWIIFHHFVPPPHSHTHKHINHWIIIISSFFAFIELNRSNKNRWIELLMIIIISPIFCIRIYKSHNRIELEFSSWWSSNRRENINRIEFVYIPINNNNNNKSRLIDSLHSMEITLFIFSQTHTYCE